MTVLLKPILQYQVYEFLHMMAEFYTIDDYLFDEEASRKTALQLINNEKFGKIYFIDCDNEIVGYSIVTYGFSFEFYGCSAFIDELYLKEGHRNKGIGKLAIEFITKQAKLAGIQGVHLEVEPHNKSAISLYKKTGFEINRRILMTKQFDL